MPLTIDDLNGTYRVSSVSDYQGVVPMKSDGMTEIKNGQTNRIDHAGVRWTTKFIVVSDDEVRMESTADPSNAKADFLLTKDNGELTQDPVTYVTLLKVARKEDKIRLSGTIQHGAVATLLTMTKV